MGVGVNVHTLTSAMLFFFLFASWPHCVLFRMWRRRAATLWCLMAAPLALVVACVFAGVEEHLFVQKHRAEGADPTPRYTVTMHWMAYDAQSGQLRGAD